MEVHYTGGGVSKHFGRPSLLNNLEELNILADAMENRRGLRYTTNLINYHLHHEGFNAVCNSTVNMAF